MSGMRFLDAKLNRLTARAVARVLVIGALTGVILAVLIELLGGSATSQWQMALGILSGLLLAEAGVTIRTPKALVVLILALAGTFQVLRLLVAGLTGGF